MKTAKDISITLLLNILFILIFIPAAIAQTWIQKDLYGGDVRVLYADHNNNVYAGTANGGLYHSTDNGSTWNYFDFGVHVVRSVVVLPSDLVLAGTDKGLFYKPLGGGQGGLALVDNPVTALVRNPNGDIYAGTGSGIYKSTDGINWNFSGIAASTIRALAVINGIIYAGTSGQGVFRSTDNGSTWGSFGLGTTYVRSIAAHPNGNIFAGTWGGVQRHNGSTWAVAGLQGLDVPDISIDNSGNIYAATWEGVYKSTNLGANWQLLGFQESITWSLKVFGDFILIGRDGDGVYKSTNGGANWNNSSSGLKAARIWNIELHNNLVFAGASSGAYRSDDYGNSWNKVLDYNDANRFWAFLFISEMEALAGGSNGIFRSTDAGVTWSHFALASVSVKAIKKNPLNNFLFAGTTTGVYRSTDNGVNWTTVNGGLTNTTVNDLLILPDGVILAATGGGSGVYRSTNNGGLWYSASSGMSAFYVYDLFRDVYGKLYAVTSSAVFLSENNTASWSLYHSAMLGEAFAAIFIDSLGHKFIGGNFGFHFGFPDGSWLLAPTGPPGIQSIVQDTDGFVYLGTLGRGVYKSSESFIPVELISFTANVEANSVRLNWTTASEINNKGFEIQRASNVNPINWEAIGFIEGMGTTTEQTAYTYKDVVEPGVYLYRLKQIDLDGTINYSNSVEIEVELPVQFTLEQNFPNPFNPSTQISFTLPYASSIRLSVFNLLGEEIKVLIDETLPAGYHSIRWNGTNSKGDFAASGMYFYRMAAKLQGKDFFNDVKKMIYLK